MPVKPIIDIDIRDEKFKKFTEDYAKFRTSLKTMPEDWSNLGNEVEKTKDLFEAMVAALLAQNSLSTSVAKNEKNADTAAKSTASSWRDISRSTRDVAGNIIKATESLLKWIGLTGVFTGLLGAGGLYGIDRMAASVAGGRRSSQGLGVSYGEQKAFDISFGPVVNSDNFLGNINDALHDVTKRGGFLGAGMSGADMQGSTADVSVNLLDHLKKIADNTNPAVLSNVMQARGLDQFVSLEEMMRIRAMTPENYSAYRSRYGSEHSRLDISRETQDAWTRFTQQMHETGTVLENVFVRGLLKLEPDLEKVSGAFGHFIEKLAGGKAIERWTDEIVEGLDNFATYLTDGRADKDFDDFLKKLNTFTDDVGKFVDGVEKMVNSVEWFLKKIGLMKDDTKDGAKLGDFGRNILNQGAHDTGALLREDPLLNRILPKQNATAPNVVGNGEWLDSVKNWFSDDPIINRMRGIAPKVPAPLNFSAVEQEHGLPSGLLWSTYGAESSYGTDVRTSSRGAVGPMQLMPRTANDLGVSNPWDLRQSVEGAAKYFEQLLKEFHNNVGEAVAAYNWGPGNMEAYMKTGKGLHGQEMPQETKDYIDKVLKGTTIPREEAMAEKVGSNGISQGDFRALLVALGKTSSTTRVDIYNATGSSVIQQTSQLVTT